MKKKTICILINSHYTSNQGGAEYQARLLTDALCKNDNYELYYVCQRADKNYIPNGYHIHLIGKNLISGSLFSFLSARKIYAALSKIRPEIIYQNVGGIQTGVAGYYAKKNKIKFLWHIASDDDVTPQWKSNLIRTIRTFPERIFLNYGIRRATAIAAQTKHQANLLKKRFGIECQGFIPIGHPHQEDAILKTQHLSVLWIANLKPLKRPELFVDLAEKFRDCGNIKFTMIGRKGWGKWFDQLQAKIKNLPNIDYIGELTQEKVNQHLSRGHILVNTSRYEGFSNTFVQAWLRKVPVVSLTVDPDHVLINEKIGFNSGTFEQLCEDIKILLNNHNMRSAMGERAFSYASENHSVEKMVNSAVKILETI